MSTPGRLVGVAGPLSLHVFPQEYLWGRRVPWARFPGKPHSGCACRPSCSSWVATQPPTAACWGHFAQVSQRWDPEANVYLSPWLNQTLLPRLAARKLLCQQLPQTTLTALEAASCPALSADFRAILD